MFPDNRIIIFPQTISYKEHRKERLPKSEIQKIVENVKALMIYKAGSAALDGSDNIILSAFEGLAWVGKLSNYTSIISSVNTLEVSS